MEIQERNDNKYKVSFNHFSGWTETLIAPFKPFTEKLDGILTLWVPFYGYTLIYQQRNRGKDPYFVKIDLVHRTIQQPK